MARLRDGRGRGRHQEDAEVGRPISAVPAETIREFARLYGTEKPVHLQYFYSCAKRHMGDYPRRPPCFCRPLTGNIACHGGCETGACLPTPGRARAAGRLRHRDPATTRCRCCSTTAPDGDPVRQKDYWSGRMDGVGVPAPHRLPTNDALCPTSR